ncbi:MAG: Bax inhibitor-1/YccA family protein, partial [Planctomycetaceae bacterium]
MRSGNPALHDKTFGSAAERFDVYDAPRVMTLEGTATKTGILLVLAVATAAVTWTMVINQDQTAILWVIGGAVAGLVLALVTIFKQDWAPVTAPLYALAEGLFLGGVSAMYHLRFQGIVLQAVLITFSILGVLLFVYRTGLIKVTENFKLGIVAATGGIFLVYAVSMVLGFFGTGIPYIHESGWIGIGFSLFVVVIASLNLVLD